MKNLFTKIIAVLCCTVLLVSAFSFLEQFRATKIDAHAEIGQGDSSAQSIKGFVDIWLNVNGRNPNEVNAQEDINNSPYTERYNLWAADKDSFNRNLRVRLFTARTLWEYAHDGIVDSNASYSFTDYVSSSSLTEPNSNGIISSTGDTTDYISSMWMTYHTIFFLRLEARSFRPRADVEPQFITVRITETKNATTTVYNIRIRVKTATDLEGVNTERKLNIGSENLARTQILVSNYTLNLTDGVRREILFKDIFTKTENEIGTPDTDAREDSFLARRLERVNTNTDNLDAINFANASLYNGNQLSARVMDFTNLAIDTDENGPAVSLINSSSITNTYLSYLESSGVRRGFFLEVKMNDATAIDVDNFFVRVRMRSAGETFNVYFRMKVAPLDLPTLNPEASEIRLNFDSTSGTFVGNSITIELFNKDVDKTPLLQLINPLVESKTYFVENLQERVTNSAPSVVDVQSQTLSSQGGIDERVYTLTALNNGTAIITFPVSSNNTTIYYPITITVYGKYEINFDKLSGKKTRNFEFLNDSIFLELRNDGYNLMSVSTDPTILSSSFRNGILSLTPKQDAGSAKVTMVFRNFEGNTITINTSIEVDMAGDDWFAQLETTELFLLFFGAIAGLALIIAVITMIIISHASKKRKEELESAAPTSSYIIRLNSTIAAAQASQKLAATQFSALQQPNMLQLAAPASPSTTALPPIQPALNNYYSGAMQQQPYPMQQQPYQMSSPFTPPPVASAPFIPPIQDTSNVFAPPPFAPPPQQQPAPEPQTVDKVDLPQLTISDEEIIERIFVEKYEPRGMAKRSFNKSKDLQRKELEKEKERIYEEIRKGVPLEIAQKSLKQLEDEEKAKNQPEQPIESIEEDIPVEIETVEEELEPVVDEQNPFDLSGLGIDPKTASMDFDDEFAEQKIEYEEIEEDDEVSIIKSSIYNNANLLKKLETSINILTNKVKQNEKDLETNATHIKKCEEAIAKGNADIKDFKDQITDLEIKLAVAKNRDKDKISKEIVEKEEKIKITKEQITANEREKEAKIAESNNLTTAISKAKNEIEKNRKDMIKGEDDSIRLKKELEEAEERMRQEMELMKRKENIDTILPMLKLPNTLDAEILQLTESIETMTKQKESLKIEVSALQGQLLMTTDSAQITGLSAKINEINKSVSEIDKEVAKNTKLKSEKNLDLNSQRRKINEQIEALEMDYDDVVKAEDEIIAEVALQSELDRLQKEKLENEAKQLDLMNQLNEMRGSADSKIAEFALKTANRIKEVEESISTLRNEFTLNELAMEEANDEEKLELTIQQAEIEEKIESENKRLEQVRAEGIKSNLEVKVNIERNIEELAKELDEANQALNDSITRLEKIQSYDPRDLIVSGSGIISRDRQKIEQENLKKQLNESKNAIEQANLKAKMAQMEAERAMVEAQRATEQSKEEARLIAEEAARKADEARIEAERKVEEARLEAERKAEEARSEAENMAKKIELEAMARQEEFEQTQANALAEMERQKKEAEALIEQHKKEAEELAKQKIREAEEAARLEVERLKAEADAKAEAEARIAKKIAKRKEEITELRTEIDKIQSLEQAKSLGEKFYQLQTSFDDDERASEELVTMITKARDDAQHAGELAHYKELANRTPQTVPGRSKVQKVTERVNMIPRPIPTAGARPQGAPQQRPMPQRPQGAPQQRPQGAPQQRPMSQRPQGAPQQRPQGAPQQRPQGAPQRPGTRPAAPGTRPPQRPVR